ncbi:unnamed protein product [Heterobilharzia americana]|nr:unnamed protein product [Heterobilharzia americana]
MSRKLDLQSIYLTISLLILLISLLNCIEGFFTRNQNDALLTWNFNEDDGNSGKILDPTSQITPLSASFWSYYLADRVAKRNGVYSQRLGK